MDRRTTIKWVLAASATMPLLGRDAAAQSTTVLAQPKGTDTNSIHYEHGYGTDPDLTKTYHPGEVWPLTFTTEQRRTVAMATALRALEPGAKKGPNFLGFELGAFFAARSGSLRGGVTSIKHRRRSM